VYPSGRWEGFWQQVGWGRQPMREFTLNFANGKITGKGRDVVGRFVYAGEYDEQTGRVVMIKEYRTHQVLYVGQPDGEGCIQGTWTIEGCDTGPFLLRPVVRKPSGEEPIQEIG
jgi:hypothetical protein